MINPWASSRKISPRYDHGNFSTFTQTSVGPLAYLTMLQPRSVVKLFGGVDYCTQCTVLIRTGTIEKGLEQRLVRYRPILYVHVYILGYIPFGGRVGPPWVGP